MGGEELHAEFERLGEVAVIDGILHKTYDQYGRAYALRWLSGRAMARVLEDEKASNARRAAQMAARRDRGFLVLAVMAICVLVAALFWMKDHGAELSGAHQRHASNAPASTAAIGRAS
jgi:hypothetical protein